MNILKEKRPDNIIFERNQDGTYRVTYTGIVGVDESNKAFVDAKISLLKCKINWNDSGFLPMPLIGEILKDTDRSGAILNLLIPDNKKNLLPSPKYNVGDKFSIDYPWHYSHTEKYIFKIRGKFEITNVHICDGEVYYVMTNENCVIDVREDILDDC